MLIICSQMENIKEDVRKAWAIIPEDAAYDFHANTMIETVNKKLSNWVSLLVQEGQANEFITSSITQYDGLSRADISCTLSSRLNLAHAQKVGVCLTDIVRDTLAEMTVQQLSVEGVEEGFFKRKADGRIDLTPNSPMNR